MSIYHTKKNGYEYDTDLVRLAHKEVYKAHRIQAWVTRFGDLDVQVHREDETKNTVWQGTNILHARNYIDSIAAKEG